MLASVKLYLHRFNLKDMAVKIRLMRIGTNRRPFYRVVAVDERRKRTGGYLELLGTYNPLTEPKEINLDQGKIDAWIKKGAVPSYGFLRIIGKAPQRAPRKAKKAPKEPSAVSTQPSAQEAKTSEPAPEIVEQTPVEIQTSEFPVEEVKNEEKITPENPEQETSLPAETTTPEEKPSQKSEKADKL